MEGYNPGEAKAEKVLDIPDNISAEAGWPSDEFLLSVGATFLYNEQTRVVEIKGRKFCGGMLTSIINEAMDDAFENRGYKRLNNIYKPFYKS